MSQKVAVSVEHEHTLAVFGEHIQIVVAVHGELAGFQRADFVCETWCCMGVKPECLLDSAKLLSGEVKDLLNQAMATSMTTRTKNDTHEHARTRIFPPITNSTTT